MFKKHIVLLGLIPSLLIGVTAYAKVAPSYEQKVITVVRVSQQEMVDENQVSYELPDNNLVLQATALRSQQARVQYMVLGETNRVTQLGSAATPPFPTPGVPKGRMAVPK
jgi:hypothetical protein